MAKIGYFNAVLSDQGAPIQATITVYPTSSPVLAELWADRAGLITKDNPFTTDVLGRFLFFVTPGSYDIVVSGSGITTYTITGVEIGLAAADMPSGISATKLADGSVSDAEFQRLDGVTAAIQDQINGKAASSHTHAQADVTGLTTTSSPTFAGVILTGLSGGYIPGSTETGLADSPLRVASGKVGLGVSPAHPLDIVGYIRAFRDTDAEVGFRIGRNKGGGSYNDEWVLYMDATSKNLSLWNVAGSANVAVFSTSSGNLWLVGDCSALTFTDRTPYPKDTAEAWAALRSMVRKDGSVDHAALHAFVRAGGAPRPRGKNCDQDEEPAEDGRNMSATLSAVVEACKDLDARLKKVEAALANA